MKIFLDTAIIEDIASRYETGLIDGVTTNPTLIKRSGKDPFDVIETIATEFPLLESISAEVVADTADGMIEQAKPYFSYENVTIKVPCTVQGLLACKNISDYDASVNVTLVFNTAQAILCAKAGADYVSPFVGRVDDNGFSGIGLISDIASTFKQFRDNGNWFDAKILSASLRDAKSVADCFRVGSDVVTMPPAVFDKMYDSVLTREGLSLFQKDWDSVSKG
jgi:TalC/MipB family fructose-6-phosphate aldolase